MFTGALFQSYAQVEDTTTSAPDLPIEVKIDSLMSIIRIEFDSMDVSGSSVITIETLEQKTQELFANQIARESKIQIEGYEFSGVSVYLEGKQKSIEKAWRAYLYKSNRIKLKSKKAKSLLSKSKVTYWKSKQVRMSNISNRMGDIITVFERENGMVKMTMVYKLGYNTEINPENFPDEHKRLMQFVEYFSQVNFREYYEGHIKTLEKSSKNVRKELNKEEKTLQQLNKKYDRKFVKKGMEDNFEKLRIDVQAKLVDTLKEEFNHYEFLMMQYKSKNSEIRLNLINSTHNQ